MEEFKVGDKIYIDRVDDDNGNDWQIRMYEGREGVITYIDAIGQLHGTWGGLALNPKIDMLSKI